MVPIVGRARERESLCDAIRALRAGSGRAVALAGEPGIGKTTLLTALAVEMRAAGLPVIRTRATVPSNGTAVIIDDLHRIPAREVPGLERLVERTATAPVLLAVAYRPRQIPLRLAAALSFAVAAGTLDEVHIDPLSLVEARELIGADAERIHAEGGGNPLYMTVLAGTATAAAIVGELAALTPTQRRIAEAAAVFGEPFPPDLPGAIAGVDAAQARTAVEALVALDLFRPAGVAPLVTFRHPVVARAVYDTVHIGRRRRDHLAADAELARQGAPVERRAHHLARVADPENHALLVAAARKVLDADPTSAAAWLAVARGLVSEDDHRRSEVDLLIARAYLLAGRPTDSRDILHRLPPGAPAGEVALHRAQAERLLGRYAEATAFVADGLDARPAAVAKATLLVEQADLAIERMEFAAAARHARLAARLAHACGDRTAEASALSQAAMALAYDGRLAEARPALVAAVRLVDGMSDAVLLGNLSCLYLTGMTEAVLESLPDADRHLSRGVVLSRRTGQAHVLPLLLKTLGDVQLRRGRLRLALATLDEAACLAERNEQAPAWSLAMSMRAQALLWLHGQDGVDDAIATAERSVAACDGLRWGWAVLCRCRLGAILIHAGDPARGRRLLVAAAGGDRLPRLARWRRPRWWDDLTAAAVAQRAIAAANGYAELADVHLAAGVSGIRDGYARRARARVCAARGDHDPAVDAATGAAERFAAYDLRLELGRTLLAVAVIHLAAGRPMDAAEPLDHARDLAERCGSDRLAEQVADARQRLADRRPTFAMLTPREREVATLAGTGATSNEIARRLFVSVRTVDSHLARVYRKLGISSRTALRELDISTFQPGQW